MIKWHPYLLVDIKYLECVQRRATKFIASNPLLDYRNRLIHLNLLPLMMEFELVDIMFLVKSVKFPSGHFNIHEFVQFCSHPTRAGQSFKLKHLLCRSNYERNFLDSSSMELLTFPRYNSISFCNKIQVTSIFLGSFHVKLQF